MPRTNLLYAEAIVRQWYGADRGGKTLADKAVKLFLRVHVDRLFAGAQAAHSSPPRHVSPPTPPASAVQQATNNWLRPSARCSWSAARPCWVQWILGNWRRPSKRSARQSTCRAWPGGCWAAIIPCICVTNGRRRSAKPTWSFWPACRATFVWTTATTSPQHVLYLSANRSADDMNKNRKPNLGALGNRPSS